MPFPVSISGTVALKQSLPALDADTRPAAWAAVAALEDQGAVPAPFGEHPVLRLRVPFEWRRSRSWRFIAPLDRIDVWTERDVRRGPVLRYRLSLLRHVASATLLLLLAPLILLLSHAKPVPWYTYPALWGMLVTAPYVLTFVRAPFFFRRAVTDARWPPRVMESRAAGAPTAT